MNGTYRITKATLDAGDFAAHELRGMSRDTFCAIVKSLISGEEPTSEDARLVLAGYAVLASYGADLPSRATRLRDYRWVAEHGLHLDTIAVSQLSPDQRVDALARGRVPFGWQSAAARSLRERDERSARGEDVDGIQHRAEVEGDTSHPCDQGGATDGAPLDTTDSEDDAGPEQDSGDTGALTVERIDALTLDRRVSSGTLDLGSEPPPPDEYLAPPKPSPSPSAPEPPNVEAPPLLGPSDAQVTPTPETPALPAPVPWPAPSHLIPEQIAARSASIGASEIATVLGLGGYVTPAELARIKIEEARKPTTHAMEAGTIFEFAVLREFSRRNPGYVLALNLGTLPAAGRVTATPDAYARRVSGHDPGYVDVGGAVLVPRHGKVIVVEAKTPDDMAWWDEDGEHIPRAYQAQIQIQMHLLVLAGGLVDYGLVVGHSRRQGWRQVRVDYDPGFSRKAVETATAWYERHVVEGVPVPPSDDPEADGWGYTRRARAGAELVDVEPGSSLARVVDVWAKAKEVAAEADSRVEKLSNALRQAIGDAPGLRLPDGGRLLATGTGERTSTDWRRIAEQLGVHVSEADLSTLRERHTETVAAKRALRAYPAKEQTP